MATLNYDVVAQDVDDHQVGYLDREENLRASELLKQRHSCRYLTGLILFWRGQVHACPAIVISA